MSLSAGAVIGIVCASLVAWFGFRFVKTSPGNGLTYQIRGFFRDILGLFSAVLIAVGLVTAIVANGLLLFVGWLVAYLIGLAVYFIVRYSVLKKS